MAEAVAIRLENLTKRFGWGRWRVDAVKDVNLEVKAGQVYGFLGPNGAGKTTAIRMMLDLIRPQKGVASLFGQPVRQNHAVLRKVGIMVEGPSFYPYLSGRRNLEVLARTHGLDDIKPRIDSVLERVDLSARAHQRFKKYSMGMKQRLGLAAALLHDPELLILDEPTNGLDPAGIQEMRYFIRELVDSYGKTVFLSSHMLNEVEQICDRVAIIHRGEIIQEGAVSDLVQEASRVWIHATPQAEALAALAGRWVALPHSPKGNGKPPRDKPGFIVEAAADEVPQIVAALVQQGIDVYEVIRQKQSLEEAFLSITATAPHLQTQPKPEPEQKERLLS